MVKVAAGQIYARVLTKRKTEISNPDDSKSVADVQKTTRRDILQRLVNRCDLKNFKSKVEEVAQGMTSIEKTQRTTITLAI